MPGPDLPETPSPLKSIQPYLKVANEHDQRDIVISYWCRLYALQAGLKISTKTTEETSFLLKLMDWLETTKKLHHENEAITNDIAAQAHIENWALKLFLYADKNDRASNFGKNVVQSFYTAGLLYDVLSTFGELSEEAAQNKKYAKWKAAYIHNCLKNGETPVPGPAKSEEDESNENVSNLAEYEDDENNGDFDPGSVTPQPMPPMQPTYPMQPLMPSMPMNPPNVTPPTNMGPFDFPSVPAEHEDHDNIEDNKDIAEKENEEENLEETAAETEENQDNENNDETPAEPEEQQHVEEENKEAADEKEEGNNEESAEIEDNEENEIEEKSAGNGDNDDNENNEENSAENEPNNGNENEGESEPHPYNPAPTPTNPGANNRVSFDDKSAAGGVELTPEQSGKAQKYIKWAGSALDYDDVPTAITNLQKALHLLKTGVDPV